MFAVLLLSLALAAYMVAFLIVLVFAEVFELVVTTLLLVWMLAATRRGAGVIGGFVGVIFLLLSDWARACIWENWCPQ